MFLNIVDVLSPLQKKIKEHPRLGEKNLLGYKYIFPNIFPKSYLISNEKWKATVSEVTLKMSELPLFVASDFIWKWFSVLKIFED